MKFYTTVASLLSMSVLAVAFILAAAADGHAQEATHITVAGRLHPTLQLRVKLDPEVHGERWFTGRVGHTSQPVGSGNVVACTVVHIPELDPAPDQRRLRPLSFVREIVVRFPDEEVWKSVDMDKLLDAEPDACTQND